ncbi:unnamed protein product [Calypogeia fissa]
MSSSPQVSPMAPQSGIQNKDNDAAVEVLLEQFEGLKSATKGIDEFWVWPPDSRPDIAHNQFDLQIPVIDMSPVLELEKLRKELAHSGGDGKTGSSVEEQLRACEAAKASVQKEIGAACEEYGFFQIVNHGVPPHLLKQLTELCQHIFHLPYEEKMKVKEEFFTDQPSKPGYNPMTRSNGYTRVGKSHVWNEGFDVDTPEIIHPGRVEELAGILWPDEPEKSRFGCQLTSTSEECGKQLSKVSVLLLDLMVGSLGLPKESLESLLGPDFQNKQITSRLRINHYPVCGEPEKTWGFHSHTDSSIITVLHQDAVGGLQVRFKDGSWHGVRPIDGALVVNVGNFLQVWSNRRFLSAEHRAVTNNKTGRISVGYFVHRMGDYVLGPWPGLVDAEHPLRYRSFTPKEYFEKLFAMGMGKDRDHFLEHTFGTGTRL